MRKSRSYFVAGLSVLLLLCGGSAVFAQGLSPVKHCTGIYVGKNLTADGSVLIGQTGDENSSHWIEAIDRQKHAENATIEVGVDSKANYPGKRIDIPQVAETNKYITVRYTEYKGFAPPLENGGINEHQVSIVDVWSPSREELAAMTPEGQTGLTYSDEARVAMERAASAEEAVKIIGRMVEEYGHATYGGNSHLIADVNEGWFIEEFAGGQGLWVAKRLGPDDFKVIRPGWIKEIPLDYKENPDYMGSDNLVSFAAEQGWYDPDSGKPFNVSKIYESDRDMESFGEGINPDPEKKPGHQIKTEEVEYAEKYLADKTPEVTVQDVIKLFKERPFTNRGTKYGQIAQLRDDMPNELGVLWIAVGPPEDSIFVPYYSGISEVPMEFRQHRYLTKGEAMRFSLPKERQGQETTRYAYRTFDRLFMLVDEHYDVFYPELSETFRSFEGQLFARQDAIESIALNLIENGKTDLAKQYLTYYTNTEASKALDLAQLIAESMTARTKVLYGIRPLPN
jgi:dipeptidase